MKPAFLRNFQACASKYRNKKVEVDGILFDSRKEAKVYQELKMLLAAGEIILLDRQVPFELVPAQYEDREVLDKKGRTKIKKACVELAVKYVADFVITFPDGEKSVIDVKGMRLSDYKIKRKLMLWIHKIKIKEV